jgi:hypothetical protein
LREARIDANSTEGLFHRPAVLSALYLSLESILLNGYLYDPSVLEGFDEVAIGKDFYLKGVADCVLKNKHDPNGD